MIRDLPKENSSTNSLRHAVDIMSCVYDVKTNLIFTGGHDGALLAWHFETGFTKYVLHDSDPTCMSKNYVSDSKSVDCLVIMEQERILLSGSCDGNIRVWNLDELGGDHALLYTFKNFNYDFEFKEEETKQPTVPGEIVKKDSV